MSGDPAQRQALQHGLQGNIAKYAACPDRFKCGKGFKPGECNCTDVGAHDDLCNNVNAMRPFRCHCQGDIAQRSEQFLRLLNGDTNGTA